MMSVSTRTVDLPCIGPIDFGKEAFGRLEVTISGRGGERVAVGIGECLRNGRLDRDPGGSRYYAEDEIVLQPGRHAYQFRIPPCRSPWPAPMYRLPPEGGEIAPFRYVEISGASGAAELKRTEFHAPFDESAALFESSCPELNRIWEFCRYSVNAASAFDMYVDGNRERLPYEGDMYVTQLSHFSCGRCYSIAKNTIANFFRYPTWPTEYVLLTPVLVRDYLLYSGDEKSVKEWLPGLDAKLLPECTDSEGFVSGDGKKNRDIIDWPAGERDHYEFGKVNFVTNCFLYNALNAMSELTGSPDYRVRALGLKSALRSRMFRNGRFVDSPGSVHTSLQTAALAIQSGVAEIPEYPALNAVILERGMACSVFGAQFLLEACFRSGLWDHALRLMTSHGLRSWINMLEKGATITMEAWDDSLKPNQDWNHAWATAPANILPRFLCGIRPVSPGFGTFSIDPHLAGLEYVKCLIPTPKSAIEFVYEKGKLSVAEKTVRIPEDV